MQFLQTNAVDFNGLLIAIRNFLTAHGWTTLADGTGGGGLSLEMTNGNGHDFKITSRVVAQNDYATGAPVAFNDRYAVLSLQKGDVGLAAGYSANAAEANDMAGPFGNVWLFTDDDATFCHVVAQVTNSRYSHFSFGDLDNKGAHAFDVPYAMGLYWLFWQQQVAYTGVSTNGSAFNSPNSSQHNVGMFVEDVTDSNSTGNAFRAMLPDALIDPLLGFPDGALEYPALRTLCERYINANASFPTGQNATGMLLDHFVGYANQGYTGGVPIFPLPILAADDYPTVSAHTYIGDIPAIGLVNMTGLTAGQVLDFAGEEWIVFPLKQYGLLSACNNEIGAQPVCNSLNYGIALKKTDAP